MDPGIFRAYDVRGVVGQTLNSDVARALGQSIGTLMGEKGLREIVVGRDGRLSGPELAGALAEGLREAGIDVIDIGAVPTPVVYYATYRFNTGCGVAVTGSHNPPDYNGFKIVVGGETLSEGAIQDLYQRIASGALASGGGGGLRQVDVAPDYIEKIVSDVLAERRLKVVVDCGNGIPGAIAPQVLEGVGCEVIPLYCDVDGSFPNHHPDPSDPANLEDLILAVRQTGADLGVAFDGDGDRLGVVTRAGEIIYPDRLLMLFARDVLSRQPGATIIYDVKCTSHLKGQILDAGGSPLMWRTGHSLIKAKMRETAAELAGEMSGHFFFKERWYGFDDGIYAAARLLEILAGDLLGAQPGGGLRHLAQERVHAGTEGRVGRGRALPFHGQVPPAGQLRGCQPDHHRRRTRGLAGWLGPGACVEHHASAGAAFRGGRREGAETDPAGFPQATAGGGFQADVAVLKTTQPR